MKELKNIYLKQKEIINYIIVGVLTTIVSLIIYYGLVLTILNPENALELQIANIISWIISVIFAYITNRKFVFESKSKNIKSEFLSFVGSRILTLLFDMGIMFVGVSLLSFSDKKNEINLVIVIVSNYVLSKLFVFKKKKNESAI